MQAENCLIARKKSVLWENAFILSSFYLPVLALWDLFESWFPFDTDAHYRLSFYLLPMLSAFFSFCTLLSDDENTTWKVWFRSILFTFAFYLLFYFSDFSVRLLNLVYPGYGRPSGGSSFAAMVEFFGLSISCGLADILAVALSGTLSPRMIKFLSPIRRIVLPLICALLVLLVFYLELTMPSWESIYLSVYG